MSGKILVIVAAAAAALLMLKGDAFGASGGVGPGDTKKATVMSGITAPISEEITNPAPYTAPAPNNFIPNPWADINTPNPDAAPFMPSEYLMGLMYEKYNSAATDLGLTPLSKKEASKLWSNDASVQKVITDIQTQGATVYTAPQLFDKRMVDYYVEIGGETGLSDPSSKKSSSSSPSTVNRGGFTYTDKPTGGTGMAPGSVSRVIDGKKYYR